jgi:hypothetical protein
MAKDTQFSNNPQPDQPKPGEGAQHPPAPEGAAQSAPTPPPAGAPPADLGEHAADPDSAVNLGGTAPGGSGSGSQMDMSGVSAIEWAALVDEGGSGSGVRPGAPPAGGPPPTGKETLEAIDLFPEGETAPAAPAGAAPPGQGPAAADLDVLDTLVAGEAGAGSGSNVGSAVDYGASPPPSEAASSGVDLFEPGQVDSSLFGSDVSGPPAEHPPSESGINLVAEDVILEESAEIGAAPPAGEGGSARDLIAEAVESGVDLGASEKLAGEEAPPEMGEASDIISLEGPAGAREESSAVDLGAVMAGETGGPVPPPPGSGVNLGADVPSPARPGSVHEEPSASTVDLGGAEPSSALSGLASGEPVSSAAGATSDSGINFDARAGEAPPSSSGIDLEPVSAGALAAGAAAGEAAAEEGVISEAAEEEEAPAAGAEEERPRPPAPAPARPRGPAWVGGGLVGAAAGVVGCLALWVFGVQPPASWRLAGGTKGPASAPVVPRTGPGAAAGPVTFDDAVEHLRNGDFSRASAAIEAADETKPDQMAKRGELRWLTYLTKQRQAKGPINANDEAVKQAVADLKKAETADAMFWLGYIEEATGQPDRARTIYEAALKRFQNNRAQVRIFEAALERLDESGPAGGAALPRPGAAALLALALTGLQQPAPQAPGAAGPPEGAEDEAGFEFWQAVKLARSQKYAEAVQALNKARALHEQRRFARLRKAQNPLSDPTEEIFLRCCDELKRYWAMEGELSKGGYLTQANRRDPVKALDNVITAAKQGGQAGAAAKAAAEKAEAARKTAEAKAAGLEKAAKDARDRATALADKVKSAEGQLAKADADLKAARQRESDLKASGAASEGALKKAADELVAAKYLDAADAKDPRAGLAKGLAAVIRMANTADPSGTMKRQEQTIAGLRREVARGETALRQRWKPEEMLPVWLALLQQGRGDRALAAKAALDADRVATDATAAAAAKARAEVVQALVLRNEGKTPEARALLEKARVGLGRGDLGWREQADAALRELANPGARFLQEADALERQGKWAQAAEALSKGMASAPAERGRLLARRALLELQAAKAETKGPLQPNDRRLAAARRDAEQAAAQGQAEGNFAAGRIAEELGHWDEAATKYRQAVAAHPALDAEGGRYRVALARVLLQAAPAESPAAPPPATRPTKERGAKVTQGPRPLGVLAVLVSLGLQPAPDLPPLVPKERAEAEKLADEVLAAPEGSVPFDVRAQALAIKGLHTRALTTYAEGLRPYLPPRYAEGLLRLVRAHPGLSRPESRMVPDPLAAEKHYAAGLNFFFARNYRGAEQEFLAAVENDSQDARFYYYLGLARLMQNKRGSGEDFEQGARLEAQGRPAPAAVSAALERVQGPARRRVNEARTRPPEVGR